MKGQEMVEISISDLLRNITCSSKFGYGISNSAQHRFSVDFEGFVKDIQAKVDCTYAIKANGRLLSFRISDHPIEISLETLLVQLGQALIDLAGSLGHKETSISEQANTEKEAV